MQFEKIEKDKKILIIGARGGIGMPLARELSDKLKETGKESKNELGDTIKIKKIGFKPKVNLKEGLEKLKNELEK